MSRSRKPEKSPKAYKNLDFVNSEEARSVRILCEYLEPKARFQRLGVNRSVIFFGSARTKPRTPYYNGAADLAEKLARWTKKTHKADQRFHIVSGGGPGIMQAAHEGAARVDAKLSIGLNISLLFEQHGNRFVSKERALEFHYFFMRKFWFANLASALVAFPGGYGTLDEMFEFLTLAQCGKAQRMPIVLYGREYWNEIINFEALARRGLISPHDLKLFRFADTPEEAFSALTKKL